MNKKIAVPLVVLFFCGLQFRAQERKVDSLRKAISTTTVDSVKVKLLMALTENFYAYNTDSAIHYCRKAVSLSEKSRDEKGEQLSLGWLAYLYGERGDHVTALPYYKRSIDLYRKYNDSFNVAVVCNNVGEIYQKVGDIAAAIKSYDEGLRYSSGFKARQIRAALFVNLGLLYNSQKEYVKAKEIMIQSVKIFEEINDMKSTGEAYDRLALVYDHLGDTLKCRQSILKAMNIMEKANHPSGLARSLSNYAVLLGRKKQFKIALEYQFRALEIFRRLNKGIETASTLADIGELYTFMGEYGKGIQYCKDANALAKSFNSFPDIIRSAETLADAYSSSGDFKNAYRFLIEWRKFNDSLVSSENINATIRQQIKYDYNKKALADSIIAVQEMKLSNEKLKVSEASLKQEKTFRYFLFGGLGLTVLFGLIVFNRFRVTKKQKAIIEVQKSEAERQKKFADEQRQLVEEKQKEILDSIYYARRIQRALITNEKYIGKNLRKLNVRSD